MKNRYLNVEVKGLLDVLAEKPEATKNKGGIAYSSAVVISEQFGFACLVIVIDIFGELFEKANYLAEHRVLGVRVSEWILKIQIEGSLEKPRISECLAQYTVVQKFEQAGLVPQAFCGNFFGHRRIPVRDEAVESLLVLCEQLLALKTVDLFLELIALTTDFFARYLQRADDQKHSSEPDHAAHHSTEIITERSPRGWASKWISEKPQTVDCNQRDRDVDQPFNDCQFTRQFFDFWGRCFGIAHVGVSQLAVA